MVPLGTGPAGAPRYSITVSGCLRVRVTENPEVWAVNSWGNSAGERPLAVVLDENPPLQYFMREALTWLEGFAIEIASPCAAAVSLVRRTRPDIVIVDPTIGSVRVDWNV